jgi:hypothetical protein
MSIIGQLFKKIVTFDPFQESFRFSGQSSLCTICLFTLRHQNDVEFYLLTPPEKITENMWA